MSVTLATLLAGCGPDNSDDASAPTEAEYRAAVQAEADCVAAEGFEVSEVELRPDGRTYSYTSRGTDDSDDFFTVQFECSMQAGTAEIQDAYLQTLRLTGAEADQAIADLIACLEDAGLTGLPKEPADSTVLVNAIVDELPEQEQGDAWACMDLYRNAWPPGDKNFP